MNEPKPIFVIRLNKTTPSDVRANIFAGIRLELPDLFKEYHVIFASGENKHIEFECYNIKDIPDDIRKRTNGLILDIINKNQF
jgi:hypothetical protein